MKLPKFNIGKWRVPNKWSLPHTLRRNNIYILPSRLGVLFLLVLITMLLASINYNNNLGLLLTFLLGSLAFISILHTYRNLAGLELVAVKTGPVFAHGTATIELRIRIPDASRHALEFQFATGQVTSVDFYGSDEQHIRLPLKVGGRGIYHPGPLKIATRYPLGLFYAWSKLPLAVECLVYPQPLSGPFVVKEDLSESFAEGGGKGPGLEDFQGLNAYQPGDSPNRIFWKAFSRGQGLLTKSFDGQMGASVYVSWNQLGRMGTERKLSRLCDLVTRAHRRHLKYGLQLPHQEIKPGQGVSHQRACLKALALYPKLA